MNSRHNSASSRDSIARDGLDHHTISISRSIVYYRACAIAALVCAVSSGIVGVLALGNASEGCLFTGLGFVLITLAIVMTAMSVACVQIAAQLRGRAAREHGEPHEDR
jgi:hypothetical protein